MVYSIYQHSILNFRSIYIYNTTNIFKKIQLPCLFLITFCANIISLTKCQLLQCQSVLIFSQVLTPLRLTLPGLEKIELKLDKTF